MIYEDNISLGIFHYLTKFYSGCNKSHTQHKNVHQHISCVYQACGSCTKFCVPIEYTFTFFCQLWSCFLYWLKIIYSVHWGIKPPQKHLPLFFDKPTLKSANCLRPLYKAINPPSPRKLVFAWTPLKIIYLLLSEQPPLKIEIF